MPKTYEDTKSNWVPQYMRKCPKYMQKIVKVNENGSCNMLKKDPRMPEVSTKRLRQVFLKFLKVSTKN